MNFITRLREKRNERKNEKNKVNEVKDSHDVFIERPKLNFIVKLWFIFIKNMHLVIRSKLSALVFFFGPLLIVFLVTLAFNTSTLYDLNVASYSTSYSSLTDSILENLEDNQYNVVPFNSFEDCVDAVKFSGFHVCIVFPPNMEVDNSVVNTIEIHVDNSRLNIANLISSQVKTKVSIESSALSEELVTVILTTLDTTTIGLLDAQATLDDLETNNIHLQSSTNSLNSEIESVDLSYSDFDGSSLTEEIDTIIDENNYTTSIFTDLKDLLSDYNSAYSSLTGTLDTASSNLGNIDITELASGLEEDESTLNTLNSNLQGLTINIQEIAITDVDSIVTPVKTDIESISSTNNYLFYLLPTVLILLIMFVALLISSSNIIGEKTSNAYFRNFITPTNDLFLLIGGYISNLFIIFLQVLVMMLFLFYMFPELGWQTFAFSGLGLLLVATLFILLGMTIGYMFNTRESVILAALSTGMIFLFFSNTIIPLETLSSYTRNIIQYNPFIIGETILKNLLLFTSGWSGIIKLVYILIGLSVGLLVGAILAQKLSKDYLNTP